LADLWILADAIGSLPLASAGQPAESFEAGPLSPDGVYFWRTVARDSHGATSGNRFFRFTPGAPSLSIDDVAVLEGSAGTTAAVFTLSLSAPSTQAVTVAFATADGTARAGEDYVAADGTASFAPGQTTATVTVAVNGDHTL